MNKNNYKISFNKLSFLQKFVKNYYINHLFCFFFRSNLNLINYLFFFYKFNFNYLNIFNLKNFERYKNFLYIYKGLVNHYSFYYNIIFMLKNIIFLKRNVEVIILDLENYVKDGKLIHFWINLFKLMIYIIFFKSVK